MIIGPYNFKDDTQLEKFIEDLKSEQSNQDNRTRLLDELFELITNLQEESENFQETIDEKDSEIERLEGNTSELDSELDSAQQRISELEEELDEANTKISDMENEE